MDLYAGEHWQEFLKVLSSDFRTDVEVVGWVMSAGYGLVPVEAEVSPYSASFGREADDRVRPPDVEWNEADWWREVSEWSGPCPGVPRTLGDMAQYTPEDLILVAASPSYLRGVGQDLLRLFEAKPETLLFCSSPPKALRRYPDRIVPFDSRVREVIGGSQVGLNIRVLAYAIRETSELSVSGIRSAISRLMKDLPAPEAKSRAVASDDELRDFIRRALHNDPELRPTPLLRRWRSMDRACEQKRFKHLFWEVHDHLSQEALELV